MIPRTPSIKPPPTPITLAKLLVVEGDTPMHFFEAFLQHLGIAAQIEVRKFGGVTELKDFLKTLPATSGFSQNVRSIGIIRDAEKQSVAVVEQSIQDAIAAASIPNTVKVQAFILPDHQNPGMIETLCMDAVKREPSLAAAFDCVEGFFDCLGKHQIALPGGIGIAKHHAQVYLATRPESQMFPGVAAYRGYWPWSSASFDRLRQFLVSI